MTTAEPMQIAAWRIAAACWRSSESDGASKKRPPQSLTPHRGGPRVRPRSAAHPECSSASIGLQVRKKFGRRFFSGKVTKALPPTEEDEEWLWQIQYEDGDTEMILYFVMISRV